MARRCLYKQNAIRSAA